MFNSPVKCLAIIAITISSVFSQSVTENKYAVGRVYLKNGNIVDGKQMVVSGDKISLTSNSTVVSYPLSDVTKAESKKGWAGGWAAGCGLSCFTVLLAGNLANPDNPLSGGQIVVGCAVWGLVSTGAGALIGHLTDKYQPVYSSNGQSFLNQFDFDVAYLGNKSIGANVTFQMMSSK